MSGIITQNACVLILALKSRQATISDAAALCPLDRVNRQFRAPRPNALWVSYSTYVATWAGFVYVAFVIDVFARRIVGWRVRARLTPASCWTRWSRRCTSAGPSGAAASSITVIAVCSTSRSSTPSERESAITAGPLLAAAFCQTDQPAIVSCRRSFSRSSMASVRSSLRSRWTS